MKSESNHSQVLLQVQIRGKIKAENKGLTEIQSHGTPKIMGYLSVVLILLSTQAFAATTRWSEMAIQHWYQAMPLPMGSDFIPSTAVNQLEMWQAATFDKVTIERELTLAEATGFTTARVFLHDLAWQEDPRGFAARVNQFLAMAAKHHIKPLLVLFDSCWNPYPKKGLQPKPTPGVHNSQWVQSPGLEGLLNANEVPRLHAYITGIVRTFANDPRILGWDVWNEPDNVGTDPSADAKRQAVEKLLPQVFAWVRAANPSQPVTSGVWSGDWKSPSTLRTLEKLQLELSDFITFHSYEPPVEFEPKLVNLEQYHRPIICTEYMARPLGSTFQSILPILVKHHAGAINWGFVAGKTQTFIPWDSWTKPYTTEPNPWFHDIYRADDTPYHADEVSFIQKVAREQKMRFQRFRHSFL